MVKLTRFNVRIARFAQILQKQALKIVLFSSTFKNADWFWQIVLKKTKFGLLKAQ